MKAKWIPWFIPTVTLRRTVVWAFSPACSAKNVCFGYKSVPNIPSLPFRRCTGRRFLRFIPGVSSAGTRRPGMGRCAGSLVLAIIGGGRLFVLIPYKQRSAPLVHFFRHPAGGTVLPSAYPGQNGSLFAFPGTHFLSVPFLDCKDSYVPRPDSVSDFPARHLVFLASFSWDPAFFTADFPLSLEENYFHPAEFKKNTKNVLKCLYKSIVLLYNKSGMGLVV